jgi:hypothetical protein
MANAAVGAYMALVCAITGVCAFLLSETYGRDMDETRETSPGRGAAVGIQEPTT